ncbi:hypothetical protein K432DRAFT_439187 [Lepidopterella palustris CBS 459.81]|uniref:NB-ARC domain-containing protein n=1 Tax=Lepidopterella palustris CBS 459.81 TaxID=1314670 RepID=A0A8E2JK86_9PEZI|nr:hypothetical protein K432DRAFT_439187 [Lepidopterella palustris CBS 459.81]
MYAAFSNEAEENESSLGTVDVWKPAYEFNAKANCCKRKWFRQIILVNQGSTPAVGLFSQPFPAWLVSLRTLVPPNTSILAYDLRKRSRGFKDWSEFINTAPDLLEEIYRFYTSSKVPLSQSDLTVLILKYVQNAQRPLVFVCLGSGGIILKQLVPEGLAIISAKYESRAKIDVPLEELFKPSDSAILSHLKIFLSKVSQTAPKRIKEAFNLEGRPTAGSDLRSISTAVAFRDSDSPSYFVSIDSRQLSSPHPSSLRRSSSWELLPGSADSLALKAILPCYHIKPYDGRNHDFKGRGSILRQIKSAFQAGAPASTDTDAVHGSLDGATQDQAPTVAGNQYKNLKTFILCGPGGAGKTEIAVEYMLSEQENYDAVFWVKADGKQNLELSYTQITAHLGIEKKEDQKDTTVSRELLKSWLTNPKARAPSKTISDPPRWLLIFDNADKEDDLYDFWPQEGQGCALVTTRDPSIKSNTYFAQNGVDVEGLSVREASDLLRSLLSGHIREPSEEILEQIVTRLDCFPLAIIQMAGIIRRRTLSLADFLELYDVEATRSNLHRLDLGRPSHGYSHTLDTVWGLSKFEAGPSAIVKIVSFLDPDRVQEEVLTRNPAEIRLPGLALDRLAYQEDLAKLTKSSIIKRYIDLRELSIHRVMQDVVKSHLRVDPAERFVDVFMAASRAVSSVWPWVLLPFDSALAGYSKAETVDRWEQCQRYVPHVLHLKNEFQVLTDSEKAESSTLQFMMLLNEAAWYHWENSNIRDSLDFTESALDSLFRSISKEDLRQPTASIHGMRYVLATQMSEPQVAHKHALVEMNAQEEASASSGIKGRTYTIALGHLGTAKMLIGQFDEAARLFEESKTIREGVPRFNKLSLYSSYIGQSCLAWIAGDYPRAADILLRALRDREEIYGLNDKEGPRAGELLYGLGRIKWDEGKFEESFAYFARALSQYRSTLGPGHISTANTCYKLSNCYLRFRDFETASAMLEQARRTFSVSPLTKRELARTFYKVGQMHMAMGNYDQAQQAIHHAWDLRRNIVADARNANELREKDFDELITYWTR